VTMATELDRAYDLCRRITKSEAKNFYYAFRTLPHRKRRAIYAAYAFFRRVDDVVDGDASLDVKRERLIQARALMDPGRSADGPDIVLLALKHAIDEHSIPKSYFGDFVEGMEMDLVQTRYRDFEELRSYCYGVASAVGLISIAVFGYTDPKAKEYAVDLGIAMQLTNILRDLGEDAGRDRIYIPTDELSAYGYSETDLLSGTTNDAFRELMSFQVERARQYFRSGLKLIPLVTTESRACPSALAEVYNAILDRIEASEYDVFSRRIGLSPVEKLLMVARLWATSRIPTALLRKR
jgi:phytoene synthase